MINLILAVFWGFLLLASVPLFSLSLYFFHQKFSKIRIAAHTL